VLAGPAAVLALECGWVVTEVGRQPWIVYGLITTRSALTTSSLVGLMFALFTVLYLVLSSVAVIAVRSELRFRPWRKPGPLAAVRR
jgi:cytochrome d ubiquinol oxidase subunit I